MSELYKQYQTLHVHLNGSVDMAATGITGDSRYYFPTINDEGELIWYVTAAEAVSPINVGNIRGDSFALKGAYETLPELEFNVKNPEPGDSYAIGPENDVSVYTWTGTRWKNLGHIKGDAATVEVGTVTDLPPGSTPTVENSGTRYEAILDFGLVQGIDGEAATIEVGTVTQLLSNEDPTVTNSGTTRDAILDFGIPAGKAATVKIGTVETLLPGQEAYIENAGTDEDAILNVGIPRGRAASISVGSVTSVGSGEEATITNVGTASEAIFDFEIPSGIQGVPGHGVVILGNYDTYEDLVAAHPVAEPGDMYTVGTANPYELYFWSGETNSWFNLGAMSGSGGGHKIADEFGFQLTQRDFLQFIGFSLKDNEDTRMTEVHYIDPTIVENIILPTNGWTLVTGGLHDGMYQQNFINETIKMAHSGVFKLDYNLELDGISPPDDAFTYDGGASFFIRQLPTEELTGALSLIM